MLAVRPFLMFEGRAEEAMTYYVSLFPNSKILAISRYGANEAGEEGSVAMARFSINDQEFRCTDSVIKHAFTFTPSLSLYVSMDDEADLERIFTDLSQGGQVLMPLGSYPFSRKFGWVADRFGVSWQLDLNS